MTKPEPKFKKDFIVKPLKDTGNTGVIYNIRLNEETQKYEYDIKWAGINGVAWRVNCVPETALEDSYKVIPTSDMTSILFSVGDSVQGLIPYKNPALIGVVQEITPPEPNSKTPYTQYTIKWKTIHKKNGAGALWHITTLENNQTIYKIDLTDNPILTWVTKLQNSK